MADVGQTGRGDCEVTTVRTVYVQIPVYEDHNQDGVVLHQGSDTIWVGRETLNALEKAINRAQDALSA